MGLLTLGSPPSQMLQGRLPKFLALSLGFHLLFFLFLQTFLPKTNTPLPVFEVNLLPPEPVLPVEPVAVPAQTKPQLLLADPPEVPAAPVPAPKPSLNLAPAPFGSSAGELALGETEVRLVGPAPLGDQSPPKPQTGLGSLAEPGKPVGLAAGSVAPQGLSPQASGPVLGRVGVTAKVDAKAPGTPATGKGNLDPIEGEAQGREVIFRPSAPNLDLERDVTVSLSFVVLSNGSVEEIAPLKKGAPALEALAIELLGQYRFKPMPGAKPQRGIIHFTLTRKVR